MVELRVRQERREPRGWLNNPVPYPGWRGRSDWTGAAGSPATIETADVALMGDDLGKLPYAVHLARRARRTIRFNIALALSAKLLLAAGAVAGVVSLAMAVLVGDMGGSLVVTLNALRLGA